jgi:phosphoadenosine phosphosulfate reductase
MLEILNSKSEIEGLSYLAENFPGQVVFSSSFGQEDQVISDMIFKNNISIKVFTLDTGRLFQETYEVMDKTRSKYKNEIDVFFPDNNSLEKLLKEKGFNSFYESIENRKECCGIRKIVPLKRALKDKKVWVTGLRAEQSENRSELEIWQYDEANQIFKYNPLINWSLEEVEKYLELNNVPQNSLHKKGFISIGCQPCTRALAEGEHPREGRWWWESSHKECGLHEIKN